MSIRLSTLMTVTATIIVTAQTVVRPFTRLQASKFSRYEQED
jgi:hypothetical protein